MKGETGSGSQEQARLSSSGVTALDRWVLTRAMAFIGEPALEVLLWDGESGYRPADPIARLTIHDRSALYQLLINPDLYFGDLYAAQRITLKGDLLQALEEAYFAMEAVDEQGGLLKLLHKWQNRPRSNSITGSVDNIHHHYDIGNDFYQLWLDTAYQQYTCAYFAEAELSLEEAQIAKLHHVCRKLQLQPGETVVEAGCGWGGLARFMAEHYGVKVKAYNISKEQVRYAREKAREAGLDHLVEYVEDDYRNISGEFDAFVSVGMLEHVGTNNYRELGDVVDRVLKPNGRGLIHTIGRNKPGLMNGWIERRIFPGAYPPTLGEMSSIFEPNSFSILDVENLRPHYAETLKHWLQRFEDHMPEVRKMFDEHFIRTWRLYLAGSIASFTAGGLQLFQVHFSRPFKSDNPRTRVHLYDAWPHQKEA